MFDSNIESQTQQVIMVSLPNLLDNAFFLDSKFLLNYINKQPSWDFVGYVTYKRTYARFLSDDSEETEEYWQTLKRVIEGSFGILKKHFRENNIQWDESYWQSIAQDMYQRMWEFKLLPAGRGLWMMGTEFVEKHGSMSLNNCSFVSTENIETELSTSFVFAMDCLMLGVGVGSDTRGKDKIIIQRSKETIDIKVKDSRKGWYDALDVLLKSYFTGSPIPNFDYSQIRPKGTRIKGFGGICEGSEPLASMINSIKKLLENRVGNYLRSVDISDIFCYIAKCVVSGNVRRSAILMLGDIDDDEFVNFKQDKQALEDRRANCNNSVFGHQGMDYSKIVYGILTRGDPNVVWLENAQKYSRMMDKPDWKDIEAKGVNPCSEITLPSKSLCNLIETFPSNHSSYKDYERTLFLAYLYGKIVTLIPTQWDQTNEIMQKQRRMGVSQSGIMNGYKKFGRRSMIHACKKGYKYLRKLDSKISKEWQIPESIKLTTVKPSGSVSLLAGVASGIHYSESEYFIRRIRFANDSDQVPILKECGYPIEPDTYTKNSVVVSFPMKERDFYKSKTEVTMKQQIQNAVDYQRYWSDNQVSITVTFKEKEEKLLPKMLKYCETRLKGIALLKLSKHGYVQAPFEAITKKQYEDMMKNIKPIPMLHTKEEGLGEMFCNNGQCEVGGMH